MLDRRLTRLEEALRRKAADHDPAAEAEAVAFLNRFAVLKVATASRELTEDERQEFADAVAIMEAARC